MDEAESKIYLGIDWGEKRIGLAMAEDETRLATPFKTVGPFEELAEVIKMEKPDVLVVGWPIKMRGKEEGLYPPFSAFVKKLTGSFPEIKIELIDERLSSQAADSLPGGGLKAGRDEIAAMLILQNYLDKIS